MDFFGAEKKQVFLDFSDWKEIIFIEIVNYKSQNETKHSKLNIKYDEYMKLNN